MSDNPTMNADAEPRTEQQIAQLREDLLDSLDEEFELERAHEAPVSRWHQRQWQQCTMSGGPAIR